MRTLRVPGFVIFLTVVISLSHFACPGNEDDVDPQPTPQIDFDTLVDIDGNQYLTVTIGTQTWMAENLRVKHFNDGTPIPLKDYDHWWSSTSPQMAYLADDSSDVVDRGILYNGHVVHSGKLAPAGWHIPTMEEWQQLVDFVGGQEVAGGKLKDTGTTLWTAPNTGATNEFGFTAKPGYWRTASGHTLISSGEMFFKGNQATYWTSSVFSAPLGHFYALTHDDDAIKGGASQFAPYSSALSIRLVKD
jgi:uncharacterized protein (TIGR02145 family)